MSDDSAKGVGVLIVLAVLAVIGLARISGCNATYSEGQRSGELRKMSHKGIVFKSWEGSLLQSGGYVRNREGSGGPDVWAFTVPDAAIAQRLEAMPDGAKVTLTYRQWFIRPWSQDSGYTVTGIK